MPRDMGVHNWPAILVWGGAVAVVAVVPTPGRVLLVLVAVAITLTVHGWISGIHAAVSRLDRYLAAVVRAVLAAQAPGETDTAPPSSGDAG